MHSVLLLFTLLTSVFGRNYKAAVVEYSPNVGALGHTVTRDQALELMRSNLVQYQSFVESAKSQQVDIIVFPEYGLNGPNFNQWKDVYPYLEQLPEVGTNPCDTWTNNATQKGREVTFSLSCMAKSWGIWIVANFGDKVKCNSTVSQQQESNEECPPTGYYQYNTQVAFGSDGTLAGKYHKMNLFYEPYFSTPVNQKPQKFTTDFGVTFGMGICFDIMFKTPLYDLHEEGVTDFVFSSWWVNTPPVLTGTVMQQSWSKVTGSNLLASNSGYTWHSSGSGIFNSGSTLTSWYNSNANLQNVSKMLISEVPRISFFVEEVRRKVKENENVTSNPTMDGVVVKPVDITPHSKGSLDILLPTITCRLQYQIR
eukprot:TRINITY_DN4248_c0_g1_i2.p1 TRINITY_DN4248_c0_g1~~TRINITY_DN4248_c0_g1_i2.p1  ORF type:complete len:368 (+),score=70.41 TRINITY_DN4248_c0_g1_i2:34-1137(+)